MLDIKLLREHTDVVIEAMKKRGQGMALDGFLEKETKRRECLREVEELRSRRNTVSEEIGQKKRQLKDLKMPQSSDFLDKNRLDFEISALMSSISNVGVKIKQLDDELKALEDETSAFAMLIPNIPHESVPVGRDENDNVEVLKWGTPKEYDFTPLNHWDIGEALDIIDFARATKITGARFSLMKGAGARLERSLMNFMLDLNTAKGYTEIFPPIMVNRESMTGTGQLPKFEEELFKIADPDFFLIPTAEVPVTNIHRDEIVKAEDLPIYYTAYTPCFRREAGSHGKDTRGLIRLHQFNKVELVKFTRPEDSYDELEKLTADAEDILQRLGLPYRKIALCTGDMGFSSAKTYDLEVWLPGQGRYREISSCSNFEDFQARRANIRFKTEGKKGTEFVHTLNGSGLAIGRTLVAILENYQQKDGSVIVPEVLRPYMGTDHIG